VERVRLVDLTPKLAARFAALALAPPVFHGSLGWHSFVHGYWLRGEK
jgi:hypothetical protein